MSGRSTHPTLWRWSDTWALAALLLLGGVLGAVKLMQRPDLLRGAADVLFGDTGYNLFVVERLLEGGRLYADVAYQYGPLPPLLHATLARGLGNTLDTYFLLLLLVSLVNTGLAYLLLRRCTSVSTALVVVGLGLSASLLIPGSLLGAIAGASYIPLERTVLLLGALAWKPPHRRTAKDATLLGLAVVSWQLVRFGGGVFLGLAVLTADLVAIISIRQLDRAGVASWLRSLAVTAIAAFVGIGVLAAGLFATLPSHIAFEVFWPRHMLDSYSSWLDPSLRWPSWGGWRFFVGQQLSPVTGMVSACVAVGYYLRPRPTEHGATPDRRTDQIRLLIPAFFFAFAAVGYFRMVFHFFQFAWALVIPAAWAAERSPWLRAGIALLLLPCFALNLVTIFGQTPSGDESAFETPSGEQVWGSAQARAEADSLASLLRAMDRTPSAGMSVLVFPLGAGFYELYGFQAEPRQVWMYRGMVRPYDEAELLRLLPRLDALVVRDAAPGSGSDPCAWHAASPISRPTCDALAKRLLPSRSIGRFRVHPVTGPG